MSTFGNYWDRIFVINRDKRTDRWEHVQAERRSHNLPEMVRFRAHDGNMQDGVFNGNFNCTASHRALLEIIAFNGWNRTLILEDDFEVVVPGKWNFDHCKNRKPFHEQWDEIEPELPAEWDMLYLGGHYAEKPQLRLSPHVIRIGRMLTTSSYGVTAKFARAAAPHVSGIGPIDNLYGWFHTRFNCYCIQPRLFVQYENHSDLTDKPMRNAVCMLDPNHEAMV